MADSFTYIVVEGIHDAQFLLKLLVLDEFKHTFKKDEVHEFWQPIIPKEYPHEGDLLKRMPTPFFAAKDRISVSIHYAGGETRIAETIEETLSQLEKGSNKPSAIGIVLDADTQQLPHERYAKLVRQIASRNVTMPNEPGIVSHGPLRTGGYVLPDNFSRGTLEDILLDCADIAYQRIAAGAKQFVANVDDTWADAADLQEFRKPAGKKKAIVSSIASVLKPGKAIQVSIQDNQWLSRQTLEEPKVKALQQFLRDLIQY